MVAVLVKIISCKTLVKKILIQLIKFISAKLLELLNSIESSASHPTVLV
jgi:hypothetical protein